MAASPISCCTLKALKISLTIWVLAKTPVEGLQPQIKMKFTILAASIFVMPLACIFLAFSSLFLSLSYWALSSFTSFKCAFFSFSLELSSFFFFWIKTLTGPIRFLTASIFCFFYSLSYFSLASSAISKLMPPEWFLRMRISLQQAKILMK